MNDSNGKIDDAACDLGVFPDKPKLSLGWCLEQGMFTFEIMKYRRHYGGFHKGGYPEMDGL